VKNGLNKRGQVESYDIVVALVLFMFIFVTLRGIWIGNLNSLESEQRNVEMRLKADQAVNSIIRIRGFPENWDSENVELIGLAEKKNVLKEESLQEFAAIEYGTAKELLKLGGYDFNFTLHAKDTSNNFAAGMPVDNNSSIVSLKRIVKYKGAEASVVFKVFTE